MVTDFFEIVAGILQGDTLTSFLFLICFDCILFMSVDLIKENGFTLKKCKKQLYPAETITDLALVNTPAQIESLLHSLG